MSFISIIKGKILSIVTSVSLMLKAFKKIYRHGGYTIVNISSIQYGQVLKGRKIVVTGGGAGIGFNIAKRCLEEGASVVITGRSENKLREACKQLNSGLLQPLVWDISEVSEIHKGLEKATFLLGGDIDILINNAGVLDTTPFPYITEQIWDKIYATNSKGLFFLTQTLCEKWMICRNNSLKKIINISSQGGFVGATYPYRMTKWDVAGLTQGLGIKLAQHGIIVNGIAPGIIATDMQPGFLHQKENVFITENPLQRIGLPEEIAELAIFLMSDSANFIVGQTIVCDGGYSIK
ncbi:SDR family NAD(P)-dependent oxidoreductase [Mucilaginibacter calamicampi]|uniref:SDR family NAD(P)-dependent oxidoreductase n=1 Tax=Mucilaginibacter calamicampi TaxID=1302352 RepID=A0ABW2YYY6_9SPHI